MNKRLALSLTLAILIVAGGAYFAFINRTDSQSAQQSTAQSNTSTPASSNASAGKYISYSASAVSADTGTKVLFFHAPWCPQCRALDTDIKANKVPAGTTIYKTDYDTNQALRKKYGITLQTTFVKIDSSGNLVKKYTAYDDPTFKALSQNIL